ncbi:hypothetical protein NE237_018438 [Protea cynaroides]|uniref:Uncharacterized protein n=1 Tax=Protea cynaroides TaxID=273540 RepID=A0A9Q0K9Z0_9MAGN|nr:hypothetical protein NE237_018438 [Protea cynaroides]
MVCFHSHSLLWRFLTRLPGLTFASSANSSLFGLKLLGRTLSAFSFNLAYSEEPPESLFMKDLRRRGMTPTSLLEDSNRSVYGIDGERKLEEDGRSFSNKNAVLPDFEKSLSSQRDRSMALNSEGLEGLIPRAKLLLTIGGTFFWDFGQ